MQCSKKHRYSIISSRHSITSSARSIIATGVLGI